MNSVKQLLVEAVRNEHPTSTALQAVHRRVWRRARRRRIGAGVFALALTGLVVVGLWVTVGPQREADDRVGSPSPAASPTESSSSVGPNGAIVPAGYVSFVPSTYEEGGQTVIPMTLPDGRSLEILHAADLDLAGLGVQPDIAYLSLADPAPRFPVVFVYGSVSPDTFEGTSPVRTYTTRSGLISELWIAGPTTLIHPDQTHWLVFRLDSWTLLAVVTDSPGPDQVGPALDARETEDGFVVMDATPPIGLSEEPGDGSGPQLVFGDSDPAPRRAQLDKDFRRVTVRPQGTCQVGEPVPSGESATLCLEAGGEVFFVRIEGPRSFVEAVGAGLAVREAGVR